MSEPTATVPEDDASIDAREVVVDYATRTGKTAVLRGASLRLQRGTLAVLRGPSGSGKTTLLMALGGLLRPQRGEVRVLGMELFAGSPNTERVARAKRLRYCFQQPLLTPYLTARQNVSTDRSLSARADELIASLRLEERRSHTPARLSAGEQQRVALARALVTDPEVLLADEPTSSLDVESTNVVCSLLRAACDDGATALVAAHDPALLPFADEVYDLNEGRLQRA